MEQSFFTISFLYDIIPGTLQVHLSAEIEMTAQNTCIVRNIRRFHTDESPLLPELKLINIGGKWVHTEGGKETNISKEVGAAIDLHQSNGLQARTQKKGNL
jgi:hypothetical protein